MNTISKYIVPLILCLALSVVNAQEIAKDTIQKTANSYKVESLIKLKDKIKSEEREFLKAEVEAINQRQDKGDITAAEADILKKEAAKKRALNIENRLAIIHNKINLLERNDSEYSLSSDDDQLSISIGSGNNEEWRSIRFGKKNKPRKYDRRTTSDLVLAFGFNNALIDGESINDSPYKIGGSGFVELGVAWKTRIFEDTNFWRLKYGFSFQWNKLDIKDNQFLVKEGDVTSLQEFPFDANKIKFRTTNLVFPVHLEFGPSKKNEHDTYFRYSTFKKLKIGLGGYAGLNIGTMQKLKYKDDGDRVKDKQRGSFNVNEFVYGVSGYVALGGTALYVKYDLNPLFKNQVVDQNNISVGVRFDMD